MRRQILRVSSFRMALIGGIIGVVLAYPLIGLIWLFQQFSRGPQSMHWAVFLILPLLIGTFSFVCGGLAALTYNLVAKLGLRAVIHTDEVATGQVVAESKTIN